MRNDPLKPLQKPDLSTYNEFATLGEKMSVVHEALLKLDQSEQKKQDTVTESSPKSNFFAFDSPSEILKDFYDLREYIRIANKQKHMRVLSVASSVDGEGSATISTYLALLMAGAQIKRPVAEGLQEVNEANISEKALQEITETDRLFTNDFKEILKAKPPKPKPAEVQRDTVYCGDVSKIQKIKFNPEKDILLVDTNLHQPNLHTYFGLEQENGLAEILEDDDDWRSYIRDIKGTSMKFLSAGYTQMNPTELLGSDQFKNLVSEWRLHFRYILFNSPPILSHVDSLSLASVADGIILVIRSGQTRWDIAQNAKRKLLAAQANLLGVALNRSKMNIPAGQYSHLVK